MGKENKSELWSLRFRHHGRDVKGTTTLLRGSVPKSEDTPNPRPPLDRFTV